MSRTKHYEWDIETLDPESLDIIDHDHRDKLTELLDWKQSIVSFDIVLVCDIWDSDRGLIERLHWYPEHDLESEFNNGKPVPKRFITEFNKVWRGAQ